MRPLSALITAAALFAPAAFVHSAAPALPHLFTQPVATAAAATGGERTRVNVDIEALLRLAPGAEVSLDLPGRQGFVIQLDEIQRFAAGVSEWRGHIKENSALRVMLLSGKGGVSGTLRTPVGTYRLALVDGANWLIAEGDARKTAVPAASGSAPQLLTVQGVEGGAAPVAPGRTIPGLAGASYAANFNLAQLATLPENSEIDMNLPNAGNYKVMYEQTVASPGGASTWVGHLRDYGDDYRVTITYTEDGADGQINTPHGQYLLQTVNGRQTLIDVNRAGLQHAFAPSGDTVNEAVPVPPGAHASAAAGNLAGATVGTGSPLKATAAATTTATTAATTIDLLVVYTDGFAARLGTSTKTRIESLVALANQAYKDSNVNITVRLVGTQQVAYTDTNSDNTALTELTNGVGALSGIAALRTKLGADLVTMLRPLHTNTRMGCGLGYVGGYGGQNIALYQAYGFSVVGDGTDMDGRPYYCDNYSFTHELGHNMGSMHDRATVATQGGGTGAYPYSFGYGKSGSFGSIMSYINPRIGKFSNPLILTCGGTQACGVSETDTANSANNALSLNNTRTAVASWRPTAAPVTYSIAGVISKSVGGALPGVAVSAPGATCNASGTTGAYSCSVPAGWSGTVTVALAGYKFTPASRAYSAIAASQVNQNYVGAPLTYTISGTAAVGTTALAGAKVTAGTTVCGTTGTSGAYSCTVSANWSGSVAISLTGYTFAPATRAYAAVAKDWPAQNFAGTKTAASVLKAGARLAVSAAAVGAVR